MDTHTEQKLKVLNMERTWATELIAAVGQFLDKAAATNCPKLKASCDQLITCGLAMISHHTKQIAETRERGTASESARMPSKLHNISQIAPSVVPKGARR